MCTVLPTNRLLAGEESWTMADLPDVAFMEGPETTPGPLPDPDVVGARVAELVAMVAMYRQEVMELQAQRSNFIKDLVRDLTKDITRALHKRNHDTARVVEVNKPEAFDGAREHTEQFLQSLQH